MRLETVLFTLAITPLNVMYKLTYVNNF